MFAMVIERPPTKLAPGAGTILWGKLARPDCKQAARYLRQVAGECDMTLALSKRVGQMYAALKADVFNYDEVAQLLADLGSSITEQYIFAEPFGGKENNPFRVFDTEFYGRPVRLLSHEWSEVTVDDLHIYVFGTGDGADASHYFVPTGEFEFTAGEEGMRAIMDVAQLDGCTKQQALVVALGATADKMPKDLSLGGYFQMHFPYAINAFDAFQIPHRTDAYCDEANDFLQIRYAVQQPVVTFRNMDTGEVSCRGGDIVEVSGEQYGLWPVPAFGKVFETSDFAETPVWQYPEN